MVRPPTVPQNTPKSEETRRTTRSGSKASQISVEKQKSSKLDKIKRKLSHGSSNSKLLDLYKTNSSKNLREIHCSCERLNNELFQFVDDFIGSQEYQDYLEFKRNIIKNDQGVQYDANDLVEDGRGDGEVPQKKKKVDKMRILSRKALRVFFLENQIEKYLENMKNSEILLKQEEAINTIRQKIAEVKCIFLCHREEKLLQKKAREDFLVRRFLTRHNIDISRMITTNKLDEVVLDIEKKMRMKKRNYKHNTKIIVEKLLRDYFHKKKNSRHLERLKLRKKKVENQDIVMHIGGKRGSQYMISSVNLIKKEDAIMKAFKKAGVCIKDDKVLQSGVNFMEKGCLTEISHITSNKSMQKDLEKDLSLLIPQEDNLYKIKLDEDAKNKLDVMDSFVQFENLLEARHFFCTCERERRENEKMEMNYPDDFSIISSPNRITFKGFEAGKTYSTKLTLRNKTGHPVRLRFFRLYCEDPKYTIYFEVDLDEIKIALPGLPVKMNLKFNPPKNAEVILGTMMFLTCYQATYYRYMVPIECFPTYSDVTLETSNLNFGTIPIWKFLKNPPDISKILKLRCSGKKVHKIVISKVKDPLELNSGQHASDIPDEEASSSSDEDLVLKRKKTPAMLEMEDIIKDILKEIDNIFHFDKKFVVIGNKCTEQSFKISLSKIKCPGFYFEKYRIDIYDVFRNIDKYSGMHEIVITLEVPDFFIRCDPVCVDFGICFYGTAYQASFDISNTSRTTQPLSVRVPSTLSFNVSLDENSVFIKSGETRRISVKLLPSYNFILEKSKYFDRETCILYFPIEVKLMDKKYSTAPPILEYCYAIINDCSDLILDPPRDHFESIDGSMVLDMGECSVSEAVTTQVVLRNSSYSKRYYGFNNLPRWMTIMPKYGFGTINAFQEISLDLFVHPQMEDFKGDVQNFREERNLIISVDTVANLGRFRRKPNMNRLNKLMKLMLIEIRRKTDIDLLESIFLTKIEIRNEFDLCSCASALQIRKMSSFSTLTKTEESFDSKREESDTSDASKFEEDKVTEHVEKHHRKKKHHTPDSADSIKKRRKSSKMKYSSDLSAPSTSLTDEQWDELQRDRQPSLLAKKSVTPVKETSAIVYPTNFQVDTPENLSRELRLKIVFTRPLHEFSFNYIEFPVTPGGSYSIMTTELRPLKFSEKSCVCSSAKKAEKPACKSTFTIVGSTQEMRVEPMYGVLKDGESIKLTLVATPKIGDDVIAAYAYEGKRKVLYDARMEAELKRREEAFARKRRKSKTKITLNTKKGHRKRSVSIETEISKVSKEEEINIDIAPEEIQVDYSDLYPAELTLWRNIEPYFLNTNFVCRVDYDLDEPWYHPPDVFCLQTVCKVVSPDFIHDQKTQHLDFGQVPIGDSVRKIITIQNLKYHDITVRTSILRPEGGFFCPNFDPVELPSECFLKIPITYTPEVNESVIEYMELQAGRTIYRFLLSAEAAVPNIRLEPSSKIIRVNCKRGKMLEMSFNVVNDSRQPVRVSLEKVCELEGKMKHHSSSGKSVGKSDRQKKKTGSENATNTFDSQVRKRMSYSDELTEEEIYSIENDFSSTKEFAYFRLLEEEKSLLLQESSKKTVRIHFGLKSSYENIKSTKKKDKRKSMTDDSDGDIGKTYVAKFNLLIGSSYFLRDFIILAEIK